MIVHIFYRVNPKNPLHVENKENPPLFIQEGEILLIYAVVITEHTARILSNSCRIAVTVDFDIFL